MSKFKFNSMLAYKRSIDLTIGHMTSVSSPNYLRSEEQPINVIREPLRATFSSYSYRQNIQKTLTDDTGNEKNIGNSNIQTIESAYLNESDAWLKVGFSVFFSPNSLEPYGTNDMENSAILSSLIEKYIKEKQDNVLATAYATNLVTGRALFRNDYGSEKLVRITYTSGDTEFSHDFKIEGQRKYTTEAIDDADQPAFDQLTNAIDNALFNKEGYLKLSVNMFVKLAPGAEVFPSQEMATDAKTEKGDNLSKVLSSIKQSNGDYHGTMHSQKLGNAIRTIDCWYSDDASYSLPVEPFGIEQRYTKAWRCSGNDFYSLVEKNVYRWLESDDLSAEMNNIHYVAACFIRGGVYSAKASEKSKASKKSKA